MIATQNQNTRTQLRKTLRQQRRALSTELQHQHAQKLTRQLCRHAIYRIAKRIGLYLPTDGEIDTTYLIEKAWREKKRVYLPVIPKFGRALFFAPYKPNSLMQANRFGISEPVCSSHQWLRARQLNLILLPLVAFDAQGNRLGMGGGFYDSSLSFTRYRKQNHSPTLIGLAHELQKVPQLPCESWDIPLNAVATEATLYKFGKKQ